MSNPEENQVPPAVEQATEPATAPHRPPDDAEEVYFEGSPLLRGAMGQNLLWILLGAILIALAIVTPVLFKQVQSKIPWWVNLILAVIGLIFILIPIIRTKTIRYRVTNYRIDFERGLLSKDIDTLELWHVEDIRFHQSLFDRMLGVGDVTVISRDDTMPLLDMRSIPNPRPLYEQLKQRVIAVKRQRGVVKMDPG
jgi:membrane protein YdbS with pleckstrin-like domain